MHSQRSNRTEQSNESSVDTLINTLPEMSPTHFLKFRNLLESRGVSVEDSRTYNDTTHSGTPQHHHHNQQQQQQQQAVDDLTDVGFQLIDSSSYNSISTQRRSAIPLVPLTPSHPPSPLPLPHSHSSVPTETGSGSSLQQSPLPQSFVLTSSLVGVTHFIFVD
jgi:hypothetical protein